MKLFDRSTDARRRTLQRMDHDISTVPSAGTHALAAAALASLADHLAVLDRDGMILEVNEAWNAFGLVNGVPDVAAIGRTVNYLDVCAKAARAGVPDAARAHDGIEAVCLGRRAAFELEYRCDGPVGPAWFLMTVTPFRHARGGAVVSHRDISAWRDRRVAREPALAKLAGTRQDHLSDPLVTAREDERRHIARELHDDVNQRLALLAIGIEQVRALSRDTTTRARLHDLWVETTGISTSVHNLSRTLHSSTLGVLGLVPAIRALSRDLFAKGLRVTVVADDRGIDLPQSSTLCLFRVAQEALGNVLKHSGIRKATLTLSDTARSVRLRVEDRGRGFEPLTQHDGLGLLSMRERLAIVGGELSIRAQPGEGTVVDARVPRVVRLSAASGLFDLRRRA